MHPLPWWLDGYYTVRHILGFDTQASMSYAFLSGPGPFLEILAGWLATWALLWWRTSCHVSTCLRHGRHPVEGTPFRTCRSHHPVLSALPRRVHAGHILAAHIAARAVSPPGCDTGGDTGPA